jgi:plasmid stabilization system protein ParE
LATLIYSKAALHHFEHILEFLLETEPALAYGVIDNIADAIEILQRHPLIGRPLENEKHELLISRGKTGYVALYRYDESLDIVFVLALRHQREAGFTD